MAEHCQWSGAARGEMDHKVHPLWFTWVCVCTFQLCSASVLCVASLLRAPSWEGGPSNICSSWESARPLCSWGQFDANNLCQGIILTKVISSLMILNKITVDMDRKWLCVPHPYLIGYSLSILWNSSFHTVGLQNCSRASTEVWTWLIIATINW